VHEANFSSAEPLDIDTWKNVNSFNDFSYDIDELNKTSDGLNVILVV
jgi:hypothetical protein